MTENINNIKKTLKKTSLHVAALALYLDVDDTTISKWNSNKVQPSLKRIDEIGDILEVDNLELVTSSPRISTGLADKLQVEYKRLLKSGMTKKILIKDSDGREKEINNPKMVQALRNLVAEIRKESKS
jgi:transcriptional regulator with XRE-family HTH domain